jgi:adenine-specific DNA-methyltransferase
MELYNDGQLYFGKGGKSQPNKKTYLSEVKAGKTVGSLWPYHEVGSTHHANEELASVMGKGVFNNPKGTKLIQRVFQTANLSSDDIVLDSFAGSGTTAHAVLALNREDGGNRKFILIECEDYADTTTAERVRRVINGVPNARDESLREGLGGSFTYCTLGAPIELEGLLTGGTLLPYPVLAAHLLYTSTGVPIEQDTLTPKNGDGIFYSDGATDYYMFYEPDLEYLRSNRAMLNQERAERIRDANRENRKKAIVYAAGKHISQRELTAMGITFCQLPNALYQR